MHRMRVTAPNWLSAKPSSRRCRNWRSRNMADENQEWQVARRRRQEIQEFEGNEIAKRQRELDRFWQAKRDAESDWDDGYVEVAGFRESRYRTSCHVGKHDPDFGEH